jgi:hypothetical protein
MKQIPPAHKVVGDEGAPGQVVVGPSSGGVRYLRDVIRKYQEESALEPRELPAPSPDAEKRLERLKQALLEICDDPYLDPGNWEYAIRTLVKNS